jgi:hypothetical protein
VIVLRLAGGAERELQLYTVLAFMLRLHVLFAVRIKGVRVLRVKYATKNIYRTGFLKDGFAKSNVEFWILLKEL